MLSPEHASFPQETLLAELDPILDVALDAYFDELKQHAKFRCVQAFQQYKSEWLDRSLEKIQEMFQEEIVDEHVYRAMYGWKLRQEQKNVES